MAQQPPTPRTVNLFTWNTQGNFTTDLKGQEVGAMLSGNDPALVFIQEGGVNLAGQKQGYTAVSGYAVGAFNERCTNYILFNNQWPPLRVQDTLLVTGNGSALIGGGVAGRTPAAVEIDRTLFISWHSLSSPNNLDTSELIRTLQTASQYLQYDLIIIGGDFNASPDDVEMIIAAIGSRQTNFFAQVVRCGQPTLKNWNKEVDFFVIFRRAVQQESPAVLVPTQSSDHEAVGTHILMTL